VPEQNQAVLIFSKAPILGTVKTRLDASLTQQQALALHWQLVKYITEKVVSANIAAVELWVSESHPNWSAMNSRAVTWDCDCIMRWLVH
jgi:glycosyltransferase A (GT-A) superfamily protein (DUF2064 family)